MRVLETSESTDVVLFWYTELSMVLEIVLLLDTGPVETVDPTLEFATLLVGDTYAA